MDTTLPSSETTLAHGARPVTPGTTEPFNFEKAHDQARAIYLRDELRRLSALAATAEHDANNRIFSNAFADLTGPLTDMADDLDGAIDRDKDADGARYSQFNSQGAR